MRIQFERSGGFGGMLVQATIDTSTLPTEQAKELESLVSAAGFFQLPSKPAAPPGGADRFSYRVTIESQGIKHTVETGEQTAPAPLQLLLRKLTLLARSGERPQQ